MDENLVQDVKSSPYCGECFVITTKHQKSIGLSAPINKILGAGLVEHVVDTDALGTFSGEISRKGTALEVVKKKCEWSLKNKKVNFAIASEGSFGPHPMFSYMPSNLEILYFVDKNRKFSLCVSDVYIETNYQMARITSFDELEKFVNKAQFPDHALIIRPYPLDKKQHIFKAITDMNSLTAYFEQAMRVSSDNAVWVETDMRAHLNPTRMNKIKALGEKLACRLRCLCPKCQTPGWGKIDVVIGLPCSKCNQKTNDVIEEVYGCTKCPFKVYHKDPKGVQGADPAQCHRCNP